MVWKNCTLYFNYYIYYISLSILPIQIQYLWVHKKIIHSYKRNYFEKTLNRTSINTCVSEPCPNQYTLMDHDCIFNSFFATLFYSPFGRMPINYVRVDVSMISRCFSISVCAWAGLTVVPYCADYRRGRLCGQRQLTFNGPTEERTHQGYYGSNWVIRSCGAY